MDRNKNCDYYLPKGKIVFLCEQDGEPERKFKKKLSNILLKYKHIQYAYLAQVIICSSDSSVMLCLKSKVGRDKNLVNEIEKLFSNMFNKNEFLDILFLNNEYFHEINKVCRPFYNVGREQNNLGDNSNE